jgi:hypothetical protein
MAVLSFLFAFLYWLVGQVILLEVSVTNIFVGIWSYVALFVPAVLFVLIALFAHKLKWKPLVIKIATSVVVLLFFIYLFFFFTFFQSQGYTTEDVRNYPRVMHKMETTKSEVIKLFPHEIPSNAKDVQFGYCAYSGVDGSTNLSLAFSLESERLAQYEEQLEAIAQYKNEGGIYGYEALYHNLIPFYSTDEIENMLDEVFTVYYIDSCYALVNKNFNRVYFVYYSNS